MNAPAGSGPGAGCGAVGEVTAPPPLAIWRPQPRQAALLACPADDVLFGGARGGGKTDAMLADFAVHAQLYGQHAMGVFFRRQLVQLDEAIARSRQLYAPLGARYSDSKKTWTFPGGARLKFRYIARDADAEAYQGHGYTRVYIEELGNFPDPSPVRKLKATLRSAAGVPCRFRATANPGGPGHSWVKADYIDPAPEGFRPLIEGTGPQRQVRLYIPSRITDNQALMRADPGYVARLRQAGSAALVRAWLEGDWDAIEGAYFDSWRAARHVVAPFPVPPHWLRFRAMDWGSARPFAVHWFAVVPEACVLADGRTLPRGCLVIYREWYGCVAGKPNTGLKLTAAAVARGIRDREKGERIRYGRCDPSMFAEDGGPSIAELMKREAGVGWLPADNSRLAGWEQLRVRLDGGGANDNEPEPPPMLVAFSTAVHLIRTLPALQHDATHAEDLDSDAEDHAADGVRYGVMSRPWRTGSLRAAEVHELGDAAA